eukprot:13561206-Alexandrium_andersonii.AAC.1
MRAKGAPIPLGGVSRPPGSPRGGPREPLSATSVMGGKVSTGNLEGLTMLRGGLNAPVQHKEGWKLGATGS